MHFEDRAIRLQLWDTAGQERFRTLIPSYIRDSAVTLVVYDVTSRASFEAVDRWVADVRRERGDEVLVFLVGNKSDLTERREVTEEEGSGKAKALDAFFAETSAKTGARVKDLFNQVAEALAKMDPHDDSANANRKRSSLSLSGAINASFLLPRVVIDVKLNSGDRKSGGREGSNCSC